MNNIYIINEEVDKMINYYKNKIFKYQQLIEMLEDLKRERYLNS